MEIKKQNEKNEYSQALLELLTHMEKQLHQPEFRANAEAVSTLLHDSFMEFGRSGRCYNREEILSMLAEESPAIVHSQDYEVQLISKDVALLTYQSAHINKDKTFSRHTVRSSLWQRTNDSWQMRFHQGTPMEPS